MKPQEKASQLVGKFDNTLVNRNAACTRAMAKECAILCVEEIIDVLGDIAFEDMYWYNVKKHIERL